MMILCPLHIREAHFQGEAHMYFRGPREWNELADNIKNTKEIDSFNWTLFNNMFHTKQFWKYFV